MLVVIHRPIHSITHVVIIARFRVGDNKKPLYIQRFFY